ADLLRGGVPEVAHGVQHELPLWRHPQTPLVQGAAERGRTALHGARRGVHRVDGRRSGARRVGRRTAGYIAPISEDRVSSVCSVRVNDQVCEPGPTYPRRVEGLPRSGGTTDDE